MKDISSWLSYVDYGGIFVRPFVMVAMMEDQPPIHLNDRTWATIDPTITKYICWLEWCPCVSRIEKDHPLQVELKLRWRTVHPEPSAFQTTNTWLDLPIIHHGNLSIPMAFCLREFDNETGELAFAKISDGALWTVIPNKRSELWERR